MENDKKPAAGSMDIHHVMKLAKLDLSPKGLERFGAELNEILGYIDMIKEADVSKINGMLNELEYDKLVRGVELDSEFYKDCRNDECKTDGSFDFGIVKSNAPSFEIQPAGSENGFFVVPQIIE
ncbi:MAG: Asp-tRNA(Asn)/Glu-tRNA(Gln) amidotransferase subunit GatC [bacterium]